MKIYSHAIIQGEPLADQFTPIVSCHKSLKYAEITAKRLNKKHPRGDYRVIEYNMGYKTPLPPRNRENVSD